MLEAPRLYWIGDQPCSDQLLERRSLVAFAEGGGTIGFKQAIQHRHDRIPNLCFRDAKSFCAQQRIPDRRFNRSRIYCLRTLLRCCPTSPP